MTDFISLLLILLLIVVSLKKLSYGFCVFLGIRVLVPESVRFMGTSISLNTIVIFILFLMTIVSSFFHRGKIHYNKKFLSVMLAFLVYTFCALVLSNYLNLSEQLGYLLQFTITDIVPVILCMFIVKSKRDALIISKYYILICIVAGTYGIISYFLQNNPYLMFWSATSEATTAEYWYGNFTTSTFVSTNAFGYFIGLSVPFIAYLYDKGIYKKYARLAIIFLIINAFLCKKRTTIVVLLFFMIVWFFSSNFKEKKKYLLWGIPLVAIAFVAIFTIPALESIKNMVITSIFFWSDSTYEKFTAGNGGSSMLLRLRQLWYPFVEIKGNLIFGHGFGWCSVYLSKGHIHPILYGFESLPSQLICEYGLMAIPLFTFFLKKYYDFVNKKSKNRFVLLFLITSIVQMIGTGAVYWYLELTILMLMKVINEKCKTVEVLNESQSFSSVNCI